MCLLTFLYIALLFFVLVPGVLLSLPPKGTKFVVAGVHALVFGIVFYFTHRIVHRMGVSLEGFTEVPEGGSESTMPMPMPMEESTDSEDSSEPKKDKKMTPKVSAIPTEAFTMYK